MSRFGKAAGALSEIDSPVERGVVEFLRRLGCEVRLSRADGSGLVALLIARPAQLVIATRRSIVRRDIEDRAKVPADGLMLAGTIRGAVAVRRQ